VSALRSDRVAVSFHSADADRLHQGCAIAAFFFWFALEALASGKLAEAVFPGRDDIAARFEHYDYPSAQALLDAAAPRDAARSAPARPHRV
jgi:hypothetical protein